MALKNKTLIAVAVFAALLAVVMLTRQDPYEKPKNIQLPPLAAIDPKTVDKVEVVNKTDAIVFEKKGEEWATTSPKPYKVDKSFENLILEKLGKAALDRPVSENKEKHKQFEVDENGSRVKVYSKGQEVLSLIVGKNTPDFKGTFVRLPSGDTVYATKEVIGGSFKRKPEEWRDKHLFSMKAEDIDQIAFNLEKETFAFERKKDEAAAPDAKDAKPAAVSDVWIVSGDDRFAVDKSRANGAIGSFPQLQWSEIVEQPKALADYGLDKPKVSVRVTLRGGGSQKLSFGDLDEKKAVVWAAIEGDPNVYQLRKYNYDRLVKEKAFYRGDAPENAPGAPGK